MDRRTNIQHLNLEPFQNSLVQTKVIKTHLGLLNLKPIEKTWLKINMNEFPKNRGMYKNQASFISQANYNYNQQGSNRVQKYDQRPFYSSQNVRANNQRERRDYQVYHTSIENSRVMRQKSYIKHNQDCNKCLILQHQLFKAEKTIQMKNNEIKVKNYQIQMKNKEIQMKNKEIQLKDEIQRRSFQLIKNLQNQLSQRRN